MEIFSVVSSYLKTRSLSRSTKKEVSDFKNIRLRETIERAYNNSAFYRDLWTKSGVTEANVRTFSIEKLPVVNKKMLMGDFERVLTRSGITKDEVEKFIASDPKGKGLFQGKYVALNTSGSSGFIGFFLFQESFIDRLIGSITGRLPISLFHSLVRKTHVAFVGEASGHHAGFNLIQSLPEILFKSLSVDVDLPKEKFAKPLTEFKPHILTGYPSGLVRIAEAQNEGLLDIHPELVVSSGEPLTELRKEELKKAFGFYPTDFYAASECLALGVDVRGSGVLEIFDEILYLEVLDKDDKPVAPGELGRVVITVLGNDIQPLVRYALDDEIVIEPQSKLPDSPFTLASPVTGRKLDCLKFSLPGGVFELHPMELVGLFFPGLKHYQVVQTGPRHVKFVVVAEGSDEEIKTQVNGLVPEFLSNLGIKPEAIEIEISVVKEIPPDPRTGKTPIIRVEKF